MNSTSLERSTSSRGARFREGLRSPITAYLALVNGFVLGFLLFLLLGPAGIALTVLIVAVSTLTIAFLAGGAIADRDFIRSYAESRGFKARPRYRLPHVTPTLRLGYPKEREGIGYATREFEGEFALRDGTSAEFVHSSTFVRHPSPDGAQGAAGMGRKASAWLVRLTTDDDHGLIVFDAPNGPLTRFDIVQLPRIRRIFPGVASRQVVISKGTSERHATNIVKAVFERRDLPDTLSIQIEGSWLFVWSFGWIEDRLGMDRALDSVSMIASAVSEAASHPPYGAEPSGHTRSTAISTPQVWRSTAEARQFEYWPAAVVGPGQPFGNATCRGAIAGVAGDLEVVVARLSVAVEDELSGEYRTLNALVARVPIPNAGEAIPLVKCVDRSIRVRSVIDAGLVATQEPLALVDPLLKRISNSRNREKMESLRFNDRFEVRAKTGSEHTLRRLLSPSFVLWCAEHPVDGLGWGWDGRIAYAYVEVADPSSELVGQICDAGLEVANRIATEAEELRS